MLNVIRKILATEPVVAQALLAVILTAAAHLVGIIELGTAELIALLGIEGVATAGQRQSVTPTG